MNPIIKYRGGKSKELQIILKYLPEFTGRYVEPFFGGGALYFHLEPENAIINDINGKLMKFYEGVRNDYEILRIELDGIEILYESNRKEFDLLKKEHPNETVVDKNESLYYGIRDMFNGKSEKNYSDALIYYFINKTAYSGMIRYNAKGEFNVPFGRYKHLNTKIITKEHSSLMQKAQLFNTDYGDIFKMLEKDDFVFLDPPYDCTFSDYGNNEYMEGFTKEEHVRLANEFRRIQCKALMVIGKTELTENLYKDFVVDEYEKVYSVNIRNRFKSSSIHMVVTNY